MYSKDDMRNLEPLQDIFFNRQLQTIILYFKKMIKINRNDDPFPFRQSTNECVDYRVPENLKEKGPVNTDLMIFVLFS